MTTIRATAILLFLFTACSKGDGAPAKTCEGLGKVMGSVFGAGTGSSMAGAITKTCKDSGWSQEAIDCHLTPPAKRKVEDCDTLLTSAQQEAWGKLTLEGLVDDGAGQ